MVLLSLTIPATKEKAYDMDKANGNTFWDDAIRKLIDYLLAKQCFSFHAPDYKPGSDFHFSRLTMIFDVIESQPTILRLRHT
jgi:hypothetical protein